VQFFNCFKSVSGKFGAVSSTASIGATLSSEEKDAIDALSHSIVSRVMDTPVAVLKAASADSTSADFVDAVNRLFNLGCAIQAPEH